MSRKLKKPTGAKTGITKCYKSEREMRNAEEKCIVLTLYVDVLTTTKTGQ